MQSPLCSDAEKNSEWKDDGSTTGTVLVPEDDEEDAKRADSAQMEFFELERKTTTVNPFTLATIYAEGKKRKAERKDTNDDEEEEMGGESEVEEQEDGMDDDGPLPEPPKKAKSAYFLFMEDFRAEEKEKGNGMKVSEIGKRGGEAWRALSEENREVYNKRHWKLKEDYQVALAEYQLIAGKKKRKQTNKNACTEEQDLSSGPLELPVSRVTKIAKKDTEVKKLSKEASLALTKATELFVGAFGLSVHKMASVGSKSKRTIQLENVIRCIRNGPQIYEFLEDDFKEGKKSNGSLQQAGFGKKRVQAAPTDSAAEDSSFVEEINPST